MNTNFHSFAGGFCASIAYPDGALVIIGMSDNDFVFIAPDCTRFVEYDMSSADFTPAEIAADFLLSEGQDFYCLDCAKLVGQWLIICESESRRNVH